MTQTTHSESTNQLKNNQNSADPSPSPVDNFSEAISEPESNPIECAPDWEALELAFDNGVIGLDFYAQDLRAPDADEYINEDGRIAPRIHKFTSRAKRNRPLSTLETVEDIRREMAKLYSDMHHGRVSSSDFTKRAYMLDCMSRVIQMDIKLALAGVKHAKN